jgi:small subunit ribosomal protein S1
MNDITEENKNQTMNTEIKEENEDSMPEIPGEEPGEEQEESMEELLDIYESSLKKFEEGQVVTGTVISVARDLVLVDVGYKSEGQISIQEFIDEEGNVDVNVNDKFEVMIEVWDEEEETVLLSREKAKKVKVWLAIKDIYDADETIEGEIISRVKGGFSVDVGLLAFLPGSQADLRPIRNMDEMVNQTYTFKILKYNQKRNNIVLSRRVLLEAERDKLRSTTLESIEDGSVMEGIVKNITEYGVFVDLGGVDGLLHITDISWGRVKHPSELFTVGDTINVKILSFDLEKERVSLGMKQLTPDPWTTVGEKYAVGSKISGKVVSLTDYGAFIELEAGVEGLIHVSEMSWTRKIRHPSQMVTVGEIIEAIVLDLKPDNRRISLGIKQTVENPWEVISQKYPVGTIIEGKIKNITEFGLFIGIDDDIDGLVHISDISWTKRIKHPSEVYKKNETIQAVVLDIDKGNERFSLGIKQTQADPWESVSQRYEVGKEISGVITNLTDFGVFVELEEGIEGLVHVSEISKENVKNPKEHYKVTETITAKVMNINSDERRIGLSIKRLVEDDDDKSFEKFAKDMKPATSSFGEILRNNIQEQIDANKDEKPQKEVSEEPEEQDSDTIVKADSDAKTDSAEELTITETDSAEETDSEETKTEEVKADEVKAEEVKADEVKADEVKAEDAKAEDAKTDEADDDKTDNPEEK